MTHFKKSCRLIAYDEKSQAWYKNQAWYTVDPRLEEYFPH